LHGADLREANLSGAGLSGANLNEADLTDGNLTNADLSGASLINTNLSGANLSEADLSRTNLSGADLSDANLRDANLRGTNLRSVKAWQTAFVNLDLRETRGLAEICHLGPSHITLNTIQLPQDGSAFHFLRGAGISDEWIDLYSARMMHPIQYYSLFISYSSRDETLAHRLHADLQASGVRCWFAPEDLKIGARFRQRIDEAIHLQDKLLLLLSEHSITSAWVENEVEAALEKEDQQQREVLFPIRLDNVVMQTSRAWATTLRRTRHIGDFTNWTDPQAYQGAFDRLLRDLKQN
jgi:uncharacterized protein YjbI with pentapeptide repeats